MSLLDQLKADQLQARKDKDPVKAALLTALVSEAAMKGKNANRDTTDEEVIATVKKFLSGVNETAAALEGSADPRHGVALIEKQILENILPPQLSKEDLIDVIGNIIGTFDPTVRSIKLMGSVMGLLKSGHDGRYDGAVASQIVKDLLSK